MYCIPRDPSLSVCDPKAESRLHEMVVLSSDVTVRPGWLTIVICTVIETSRLLIMERATSAAQEYEYFNVCVVWSCRQQQKQGGSSQRKIKNSVKIGLIMRHYIAWMTAVSFWANQPNRKNKCWQCTFLQTTFSMLQLMTCVYDMVSFTQQNHVVCVRKRLYIGLPGWPFVATNTAGIFPDIFSQISRGFMLLNVEMSYLSVL